MSSSADYSAAIQEAVNAAYNAGVTIFASSGNRNRTNIAYPAGYENVIGVGATKRNDAHGGSNYNSSVDLSAPGKSILTTMPTYDVDMNDEGYAKNYDYFGGTSASSPIAAGVGALVLSHYPNLTPAQLEQRLENNADDLGAKGRDDYFGYGRVNAYASLLGYNFLLKSNTHKISANYYKKKNARFTWNVRGLDNIKGYSFILSKKSKARPDAKIDTKGKVKVYKKLKDGTWYFRIRAIYSNQKKSSAIITKRINIDNFKPKTFAPKASRAKKGKTAKVFYKIVDPYSGNKVAVHLYILYRKKLVHYSFYSAANRLKSYSFKANLARGKYKFLIYAKDAAGNWQQNTAKNYLTVY